MEATQVYHGGKKAGGLQKYFGALVPGPAALQASPAPATPIADSAPSTGKKKAKLEPPTTTTKKRLKLSKAGRVISPNKKTKIRLAPRGRIATWGRLSSGGVARPRSAYNLWTKDNRKKIQEELDTTDFATVSKAVGEKWATLTAEEKAPYEKRHEEMHKKYVDVKTAYKEYA